MNALRVPRVWASPIARLYHGTARSLTTSSPLVSETAPNAFRRTEKYTPRFQSSTLRSLSTEVTPEVTAETAPRGALEPSAEVKKSSPPPPNPKAAHLPYQIGKTKSGNLPVFEVHAAGRIKATVIRKVKGDMGELAGDLKKALNLKDSQLRSSETTRKIEVAGKKAAEVKKFLRDQGLGEEFDPLSLSGNR
ncbi:hypothetical protein TWF730_003234 [Orbilia blumenaviensis]|uniref:Large ribosomal subunit protein mL49 n=1 Tax=Orbilia blumenaviensis TaxID=1796055 RepID=A0AAV9U6A9_9PEZI